MCLQLSHQNPVEINITPPGTPGILTGIRAGMEAQTAWPGGNLQVLPWLMGSVALGLPSHTIQGGFLTTPHWLTPRALACCSGSCLNKPLRWTAFLPRGRRNLAWFMRKRATFEFNSMFWWLVSHPMWIANYKHWTTWDRHRHDGLEMWCR